jgi:very-short-patch-repair endonuclease
VGVIAPPRRTDMRGGTPLRQQARALRGKLTNAERVLWRELRQYQLGTRFRRQFPIHPYVVDFARIEARLIVEADGGQHAISRTDARRDAYLTVRGWRILRFWNNDILGNRAGVLQTIAEALGTYPHPDPPPPAGEGARRNQLEYPTRVEVEMKLPPPPAGEGQGGG